MAWVSIVAMEVTTQGQDRIRVCFEAEPGSANGWEVWSERKNGSRIAQQPEELKGSVSTHLDRKTEEKAGLVRAVGRRQELGFEYVHFGVPTGRPHFFQILVH